jgi:hypothetical protein
MRGEVMDKVLHPGKIGVALGWGVELPAHVGRLPAHAPRRPCGRPSCRCPPCGGGVRFRRSSRRGGWTPHALDHRSRFHPSPRPDDSLAPARSALVGPWASPNPFRSFPNCSSALRGAKEISIGRAACRSELRRRAGSWGQGRSVRIDRGCGRCWRGTGRPPPKGAFPGCPFQHPFPTVRSKSCGGLGKGPQARQFGSGNQEEPCR